jgi:hypothetical protein
MHPKTPPIRLKAFRPVLLFSLLLVLLLGGYAEPLDTLAAENYTQQLVSSQRYPGSTWQTRLCDSSDFTMVVIPDPQYYASAYPFIYNAQMQWVAENKIKQNIVYVASLGDNVDNAGDLNQWRRADAAFDILDQAGVPYGLEAGNHDGAPYETGNFNAFFGEARFAGRPTYGGHFGSDQDNHYARFEVNGLKFILIFIEFDAGMTSPSHPVLAWVDGLLRANLDYRGIVISHNMLQGGASNDFSPQGLAIYKALRGNANLFLMMGGHLDVAARRMDTYRGHRVYTLRSDYQFVDDLQTGYLRILRFSPAGNAIFVSTYSPTQDKYYPDLTDNNFSLPYDMGGSPSKAISC